MTTREPIEPDDLTMVANSDALLDALAAGAPVGAVGDDQASAALLSAWRMELDARTAAAMTTTMPTLPATGARHWMRVHRKTAAATALVVAIAGSTGVAAAASGRSGPLGGLHRLFFGDSTPPHRLDPLAANARQLLDVAERQIKAAQAAGSISATKQNKIATELDDADGFLSRDRLAPAGLLDRLNQLRDALARIPVAADGGVSPSTGQRGDHEGGDEGGDDRANSGRGSDDSGRGSDDQGEDSGSDEDGNTGSDDGGGSDGGFTNSGDHDSGDDDGVASDDEGSGSGASGDDELSRGDDGSGGDDSSTTSSGGGGDREDDSDLSSDVSEHESPSGASD